MKDTGFHNLAREHKVGALAGIAAYNEARYIGSIVLQARQYVDEVIVVDDCGNIFSARSWNVPPACRLPYASQHQSWNG